MTNAAARDKQHIEQLALVFDDVRQLLTHVTDITLRETYTANLSDHRKWALNAINNHITELRDDVCAPASRAVPDPDQYKKEVASRLRTQLKIGR